MTDIDRTALNSMSVAPGKEQSIEPSATDPQQDAGQDESIAERLKNDPDNTEARLDNGLDETMDASDPVSLTQPRDHGEPAPSSGYDPAKEQQGD